MSPFVTDAVRRVVESPFGDALSRGVDWMVICLVLALLVEHEYVRYTGRDEGWKRSRLTWMYAGPLVVGVISVFVQRLTNLR